MSERTDTVPGIDQGAPRRVDLSVAHVDAWSVMKVSFLLSVAVGIGMVVATFVLWNMLDGMHVFADIEDFLTELSADSFIELLDYVRLPRVMSYATIFSVLNVVLLTALATIGALLYNLIATLVGGVRVSLMDE